MPRNQLIAMEITAVTASQNGSGPQMSATTRHEPTAHAMVPATHRTQARLTAFGISRRVSAFSWRPSSHPLISARMRRVSPRVGRLGLLLRLQGDASGG